MVCQKKYIFFKIYFQCSIDHDVSCHTITTSFVLIFPSPADKKSIPIISFKTGEGNEIETLLNTKKFSRKKNIFEKLENVIKAINFKVTIGEEELRN